MTVGNIVDLLDQTSNTPLIVQEGESMNIEGSLVDFDGGHINKSGLDFFRLSLYDKATETIINSRDEQNILDANQGTVDPNGHFVLRLGPADAIIVGTSVASHDIEFHIARFSWGYNDGSEDRTAIQEIRFRIQQLPAAT